MARIGCRNPFRVPAHCASRKRVTVALAFVLSLAAPSHALAAKLSSFLTPKDLARPVLLDQNGQQLELPSSNHPRPAFPQGSTPTYLALPLYGGEHLPNGISTIFTGQGGPTVGPLDFNASVVTQVNTALASSGLVAVDAPQQNYVVEYLPRLNRSLAGSKMGAPSMPATQATPPTSAPAATTSSANNEISQFLGGSLSFGQLAKNTVNDVENLFHIKSSKPTARKPSLNLEAQVIDPPLPAPIPEPSSWLIFGLAIGAIALHRQLRRRRGRRACAKQPPRVRLS
jgi:hypothetical protein